MAASRITRASLFIVALCLAAVVVVLGGLSFQRKVETFQPLGFSSVPAGEAVRVTAVDSPGTGLETGDQLLLVDGRTVSRAAELTSWLRSEPQSDLGVLRGGELVVVSYQRPALDPDVPYLILALAGVAFLLIGLYTLLRDRERRAFLFYLWALASAALFLITPGDLAGPLDTTAKALFLADQLARIALPPLMLHLFLVFPLPLGGRVRRWAPFLYLPAAVLLSLRLDLWLNDGAWLLGGRLTAGTVRLLGQLEVAHVAAFAVAAVAVLVLRLAREKNWERAGQVRWIAAGMVGGYLPFVVFSLAPAVLGLRPPELVTAAGAAPLVLVPMTFAYAILRYKLWDIDVILRDAISSTLTLLLGIIGFSLINLTISRGLPQEMVEARNLVSFAAGLVIAGLLLPTRRNIAAGLERFQYRGSYDKRRALAQFAHELVHERDLVRLANRLLDRMEDGVELERANLYLSLGDTLIPVRPEPGLPSSLAADALGEDLWQESFLRLSGVALPGDEPPPRQRLFAAGYRYVYPLTVRDSRVGLALTSFKRDDTPLNSDDTDLIRQLLDQAALAIENAQLLDQLRHKLDEVVELQQYNEGIIESSPAGIAVIEPDGVIVSANAAFAALAGCERRELPGRRLGDALPVGELPQPGGPLSHVSYDDEDGDERHLQVSSSAFPRRGGSTLRIVVVHDVSDRMAMEAALKEKDRLAALGALAAGVAHEVNTPITGISSYAQMLLADTDDGDPRYAILKKVERQTFRATQIVNSLLEFARQREHEQAPVKLAQVVDESLDLLRPRLTKRRVRVDWQMPDGEPLIVLGNAGELQQVITNLLLNGSDALTETGGRMQVELAGDGDRVVLTVADDGPGMSPERLRKIFEPFFTTKLGRGGTGLGLSISYEIVQRHGGEMRVESEPGEGARFTVELPRDRSADAAAAPA